MNKLIYISLVIFTLVSFASCSSSDDNDNDVVVITSLKINPVDKDLYIGNTYQLTVAHEPSDIKLPTLTWKSSDTSVATVSSSGKVTAVSDGVATVTVSYGSLSNDIGIVILKKQDYTSFVFVQIIDNKLPNCVAGYKKDGKYYKLGDLGTLKTKNQQSSEIRVNDNTIEEVYFFTDYNGCVRFNKAFVLKTNIKNEFRLEESIGGIGVSDKTDPKQYPQ